MQIFCFRFVSLFLFYFSMAAVRSTSFSASTIIISSFATTNIRRQIRNFSEDEKIIEIEIFMPLSALFTGVQLTINKMNNTMTWYGKIQEKTSARKVVQQEHRRFDIVAIDENVKCLTLKTVLPASSCATFELQYEQMLEKRDSFYRFWMHLPPCDKHFLNVKLVEQTPVCRLFVPQIMSGNALKSTDDLWNLQWESIAVDYKKDVTHYANDLYFTDIDFERRGQKIQKDFVLLYDLERTLSSEDIVVDVNDLQGSQQSTLSGPYKIIMPITIPPTPTIQNGWIINGYVFLPTSTNGVNVLLLTGEMMLERIWAYHAIRILLKNAFSSMHANSALIIAKKYGFLCEVTAIVCLTPNGPFMISDSTICDYSDMVLSTFDSVSSEVFDEEDGEMREFLNSTFLAITVAVVVGYVLFLSRSIR